MLWVKGAFLPPSHQAPKLLGLCLDQGIVDFVDHSLLPFSFILNYFTYSANIYQLVGMSQTLRSALTGRGI